MSLTGRPADQEVDFADLLDDAELGGRWFVTKFTVEEALYRCDLNVWRSGSSTLKTPMGACSKSTASGTARGKSASLRRLSCAQCQASAASEEIDDDEVLDPRCSKSGRRRLAKGVCA